MGQFICSIDEQGVTDIFRIVARAVGPQANVTLPCNQTLRFPGGSVSMDLSLTVGSRLVNDSGKVDLRGTNMNPRISWTQDAIVTVDPVANLGFKFATFSKTLTANPQATNINFQFQGSADVHIAQQNNTWTTKLTFTLNAIALNLATLRQQVIDAVKNTASQLDTNPLTPGTQHLSGAVIDDIGKLAGTAFDALAPQINAQLTQLSQGFLPVSGEIVLPAIPSSYNIAGNANVNITNATCVVTNSQLILTISFS